MVAIIPARNEAEVIGAAVTSLLAQGAETVFRVIVVDDASTDGTARVAAEVARNMGETERLTVLTGKQLIAGWTGKLWAQSQAVEQALLFKPDYLLLTDADIRHAAGSVKKLAGIAEASRCDLASYMVRLACESRAEKALIPAFVFFFLLLYPPTWIAEPRARTAGAAGGCILIRPEALAAIGGLAAIRNEVIDDCALARAVKRNGGRLWMGLTADTRSIRRYSSFTEIGRMISRTAFSQLKHSYWLLLLTIAGLTVTYVVPVMALFSGKWQLMAVGGTAWLLMALSYWPMVRFYQAGWLHAVALPGVAVFYAAATVRSAALFWRGKGGEWKGRAQDSRHH